MKRIVNRSWLLFIGIFILLVVVRVPYYYTHHIQEDAYITLRCAENLAETGVYGFNAGERVSASTSHLYAFLAAFVRLVAGKTAFIPAIQVMNTIFFVAGAYFFARVLGKKGKSALPLWVILSLLPISLLISYSGMETSLLIFLTGLSLYLLHEHKHYWLAASCVGLFPWIRPDAIAYSFIIIFWDCLRDRKIKLTLLGALIAGVVALLAFNQLYFGAMLNQSIIAKAQTRHAFSIKEILSTIKLVFLDQNGGIFSPLRTKYLDKFGIVFLVVILVAAVIYVLRNHHERNTFFSGLAVASLAFLIPIAYSVGGVIFQWYFWPSIYSGYALFCALLLDGLYSVRSLIKPLSVLITIALLGGMTAQWVFSYSWGMKEYAYRGGIGKELAELSQPGDTLFLEPAGYIPFYSGLYTYDEAGLGSPLVLHYRELYKTPWWIRFVEEVKPTWIVQREQIASYTTYQGYTLNGDEKRWFDQNYHLVEKKTYRAQDYATNPLLLRFLSLGTADDYYVFEINK